MTPAHSALVEPAAPTAAPAPALRVPPLLPARGDELGPQGRRWLTGGVVAAHLVGGWALLQIDAVREVVLQAAPTIMVDMIAPPEPPKPVEPPPPAPQPKKLAPAPAPIIAAAPTPTLAPTAFVTPPPDPVPAPVAIAPAPPAPPAPVPAPPPAPVLKRIPPSAVRYVALPRLNFPLLSKRAHESGTVVLRIAVDVNGRLKDAWVHKTSGFERIDQAALQDIRSARFAPQMEDGKAVEWETLAPLAYDL